MALVLLDTNVLVHAIYRNSPLHAAAGRLLDQALRTRGRYCIAPQNIVEFSAVVTRSRFVDPPLSGQDVHRVASLLYRSRRLAKIYPQRGTIIRAIDEGAALGITGAAWYDLFLATTMRDAGVSVVVTENVEDFRKFTFVAAQRIEQAAKQEFTALSAPGTGPPGSFFAHVYALVRRIPPGRVATYGEIARVLGDPRAARTVGWALRACGDDIPWHRVVNAQGRISWRPTGGYRLQRALLRQEGVRVAPGGRIDLGKFGWRGL